MLDEPSLSRQWVARRLQRALSTERWCGPLREGLSSTSDPGGEVLRRQSVGSAQRARRLESLLQGIGTRPYASWGVGARLARLVSRLLPLVSRRLTRRAAHLIATHTLAEYRALAAFVEDAPGVDDDVFAAVSPMHAQASEELSALETVFAPPR